jgi:hypothetical protein
MKSSPDEVIQAPTADLLRPAFLQASLARGKKVLAHLSF